MNGLFEPYRYKVGFTGTQTGMNEYQKSQVRHRLLGLFLENVGIYEFHHGDCIGADVEAAQIAKDIGYYVVSHPPINSSKRGWFKSDSSHAPLPYLDRNRDIVKVSHRMLAAPKEFEEQLRSGTWATIRYARKTNKELEIIYPKEQ